MTVLSFDELHQRYLSGDVHDSDIEKVRAVYTALIPYFDLLATPENMWMIQRQILIPVRSLSGIGDNKHGLKVTIGALSGAEVALEQLSKEKVVKRWETNHHFLHDNKVTAKDAVNAYYRGNATIGELFFLQPSIFVD